MRVVTAASKLVESPRADTAGAESDDFDAEVVSALGEAFNNIAIHGYADHSGEVEIEIDVQRDRIVLRVLDRGKSFDRLDVPSPDLDALPERGMGLFIIENFVDELRYTPGDPNELVLVKRRGAAKHAAGEEASADPKPRSSSGVRATELPRATRSDQMASQVTEQAPKYGTGRK
jgi:serine/threonine-protein kinase RsbW